METNKEIRNDELKTAMIKLKLQNDKEAEDEFISEVRKAFFLIPAVNDDKDDELSFMLLADQNEKNYFQAYTDLDEYNKWSDSKNSKHFILTFDEYANIVTSSDDEVAGLVINPFTENIILNKEILHKIFVMDKIFIDEVKDCPKKEKDVIKKALASQKEITKAYLMYIEKSGIPGFLLIIESKAKDKKELYDKIAKYITENIDQINIDIMSTTDDIAKDVIKNKKEFYNKK